MAHLGHRGPRSDEISRELKSDGLTVRVLWNKHDGLDAALNEDVALVILAHPLAGEDSLGIIEAMRTHGAITPVFVISPRGAIDERIRGLRSGADDYLVLPFTVGELAARVDAIMLRIRHKRAMRVRVGSLEIEPDNQLFWRNGRRIELFPREFKILEYRSDRATSSHAKTCSETFGNIHPFSSRILSTCI